VAQLDDALPQGLLGFQWHVDFLAFAMPAQDELSLFLEVL